MICRWSVFQRSSGNTRLEVALDLLDVARARQAPAPGEPVDVRVDRERGHAERLRHHHARGLVADAGQRLERLEVARDLAAVLRRRACAPVAARFFALPGARPHVRMNGRISRGASSSPSSRASGARANSAGVTRLTRASVHCAESIDRDQQLERRRRDRAGSPASGTARRGSRGSSRRAPGDRAGSGGVGVVGGFGDRAAWRSLGREVCSADRARRLSFGSASDASRAFAIASARAAVRGEPAAPRR